MSYTKKLRTSHSYIPSSNSESEPKEHDVFLSFRGEDTRNTFTDHLYRALVDKGISTFMDDDKIGIGKPISPELLLAIEKSSVAVIVLSRNYASSTWCLQELAKIIECMKEKEMRVLPIFYQVDPSDVRNQTGTIADAFAEHEIRFGKNLEVQTWRNALREVANLSGRHLQNGDESMFIKSVVEGISRELINLVGDDGDKLSDMASTISIETTPSSPSSSSKHRWKYEVFLSFSGETRDIFTSHLCYELCKKFISTFKDDDRLDIGRPIKKDLLHAIEKSRMAVIIISKEYALSTWCLEELAKIVECMEDTEMKVLPIFYHVEPRDVWHQGGTFRDAFALHEQNLVNEDKVQTWRNALKKVANLSGFHLKSGRHFLCSFSVIFIFLIYRMPSIAINHLDKQSCITARFTSNSPSIAIKGCGACILYEQDMMQLVQILSQKNLGCLPPFFSQVAGIIGPHDNATSPLDFHPFIGNSF